ncbi:MAG: hypothetical protein M1823_001508 [Watsoniomyces obsoletus]|nr:MAG: hypothetical protein M1823_001508 [Watsoniomyces obsoletus]
MGPTSQDMGVRPNGTEMQPMLGTSNTARALPWMNGHNGPKDKSMDAVDVEMRDADMPQVGDLYEQMHGVSAREEHASKRQKLGSNVYQNGSVQDKASPFTGGGKGGVIGDYMNQKNKDVDDNDDVVELPDPGLTEICYGEINGYTMINAHAVPTPPQTPPQTTGNKRKLPKLPDHMWPQMGIGLRRGPANTDIIYALDPLGYEFGTVDSRTAIGLAPLMDPPMSIEVAATLQSRQKQPQEMDCPRTLVSLFYHVNLVLYGPRQFKMALGRILKDKGFKLRNPVAWDQSCLYENPHFEAHRLAVHQEEMEIRARRKQDRTLNRRSTLAPARAPAAAPTYVQRTVEDIRNDVQGVFDTLQKSEHLTQIEPDNRIVTPLLAHQKQALHFMTEKEKGRRLGADDDDAAGQNSSSLWRVQMRDNGQKVYYNVITGKEQTEMPTEVLGGILADMMGLGKTLSVLSLIVSTLEASKAWAQQQKVPEHKPTDERLALLRNSKTTLLVTPLSTMANWEDQIETHLKPKTLKVHIYHGGNRCNDINRLGKYDIVITTYNVVASEFNRRGKNMKKDGAVSPLQQTNWFRIVLDEAHMIREQSTRQSKAICALSAQRRWAVTGTPVQNRLEDLGALIKFLRISPFDERGGFAQYFLTPFKNADPDTLPKLRVLVDSITLRRLKDRIDLPARRDRLVRLEFDEDEKALYDMFAKDSTNKMRVVANEKQGSLGGKAYAHVLKAILRLRLICAHGRELLNEEDLKIVEGVTINNAIDLEDGDQGKPGVPGLSARQAYEMFNLMNQMDQDNCQQCNQKLASGSDAMMEDSQNAKDDDVIGYLTPCLHLICKGCIKGYQIALNARAKDGQYATCPLCAHYIRATVFQLLQSKVEEDEESHSISQDKAKRGKKMGRYGGPHTKTRALLGHLKESQVESEAHPEEKPIKSVVFSGWTTHLDLIQVALENNDISYVRLDGKMSRDKRSESMETFRDDPTVTVMLVSIKAGGLGLNLTTASKVYVMEPQFNPAAEAQAIDRVHRLGQTREVETVRFIMADSFEEKMLELQRKKENLADLSMNSEAPLDKHEAMKKRLEELRSLFK